MYHENLQKRSISRSQALHHHHLGSIHHVLGLDGLPHSESPHGRRRERHRGLDLLGHGALHGYLRVRHQRDIVSHCTEGHRRGLWHQDGLFHRRGLDIHVVVAALHH